MVTETSLLIWLAGGALLLVGFVGCVIPVLPGPLLGYLALWLPWLAGMGFPESRLWLGGAVTAAVTVVDYVLPAYFARKFKCSKSGMLGCFLGTIIGLFFFPWGLVLGPVLGTMLGELTVGKSLCEAARGGAGAFCGFVATLFAKLAAVGLFAYWFVDTLCRGN